MTAGQEGLGQHCRAPGRAGSPGGCLPWVQRVAGLTEPRSILGAPAGLAKAPPPPAHPCSRQVPSVTGGTMPVLAEHLALRGCIGSDRLTPEAASCQRCSGHCSGQLSKMPCPWACTPRACPACRALRGAGGGIPGHVGVTSCILSKAKKGGVPAQEGACQHLSRVLLWHKADSLSPDSQEVSWVLLLAFKSA